MSSAAGAIQQRDWPLPGVEHFSWERTGLLQGDTNTPASAEGAAAEAPAEAVARDAGSHREPVERLEDAKAKGRGRLARRSRRSRGGGSSEGPDRGTRLGQWIRRLSFGISAALLLGLPLYLAWDYGGVLPWTQWLASCVVLAMAVVSIPLVIHSGKGRSRLLAIPILCLIAWTLAGLQSLPLGERAVGILSVGSARAYSDWIPPALRAEMLESEHAGAAAVAAGRYPVSICTQLTRVAQSGPALFAVVCVIASVVFRSRGAIVTMLWGVALSGAVIAFLGIADQIRAPAAGIHNSVITPDVRSGAPFGPFVCRNNAAGYLNLTLAASLGLLVYCFRLAQHRSGDDLKYRLQPEKWWDRPVFFLQNALLQIDAATMAALVLVVLSASGVLASQSRGGTLALVAGTAASALLTGKRSARSWRPLGILLSVGGVAILLGSVGLMERIRERLATLWSSDAVQDGRLDHWPDGLAAAWQYFPSGAGLGTYRYAYLPYQRTSGGAWFVNADNMAVEWLVEGGIWLLPLVIAGVVVFASCLSKLAAIRRAPHLLALVATGWFVIGSQMVSEFFDFGILLPANHLTLAVIIGAVVGASARHYRPAHGGNPIAAGEQVPPDQRPSRALLATFALAIIPLLIAARTTWQNANDDYRIHQTLSSGGAVRAGDTAAEQALLHSNNPSLHTAIAAQIIGQQERAGERALRRLSPDAKFDHFQLATLEARRAAFYLNAVPADQPAEAVLLPGQSVEALQRARQHAATALLLCPLDDVARMQLLQTGFVAGDSQQTVSELLDQWGALRQQYGESLERVARIATIYPGRETALPVIKQLLAVDRSRLASIWVLFELLGGERVIADVLPADPVLLLQALETQKMGSELRQDVLLRLSELLVRPPDGMDQAQWASLVGRMQITRGDDRAAEEWFRRAVAADPSTTAYRFRYAETLERNGKHAEALEQISHCLLQDPTNTHYQGRRRAWMARKGSG